MPNKGNTFPRQCGNRNIFHNEKVVYYKVELTSSWNNKCPSDYLNFILSYTFSFSFDIPGLCDLCEGRKLCKDYSSNNTVGP